MKIFLGYVQINILLYFNESAQYYYIEFFAYKAWDLGTLKPQ